MRWLTPIASVLGILLMLPLCLGQTISIVPSSQNVDLPNNAVFDIEITGVTTPVYGFSFSVSNSSDYWDLVSVTEGNFLSNGGIDNTGCVGPTGDQDKVASDFGCTRLGSPSGITGSGTLATVTLSSNLQAGTTTFTLTDTDLSTIDSQPITHSTNGGTVTSSWCTSGTFQDCQVGGEPQNETGECSYGQEECVSGEWSGLCNSPAPTYPTDEECDGLDNDCDGQTDEGCDDDSDDYCDAAMTTVGTPAVCPNGGGDCDDTDGNVYPGATEICDDVNNDCDGSTDEFCDGDNDDFCNESMTMAGSYACSGGVWCCPFGGGDCDDSDATVNPNATEECDDVNNDCDASTDEDCDDDSDDYCDAAMTTVGTPAVCPNGGGDCDDDPGTCGSTCNPGVAQDVCPYTEYDEDCDGYEEYKGDTWVPGSSPCDGCVDVTDLSLIGTHFGETSADAAWEAGVDLIGDTEIDIFDLVMVGSNFGTGLDGATC